MTPIPSGYRASTTRAKIVCNILNGNDARFPQATRERVISAAKELDYRPSPAGRSLVNGRSDTVVVLLPNTTFGNNLQDAVDRVVEGTKPLRGNVVVRFARGSIDNTVDSVLALRPLAVVDFGVLTFGGQQRIEKQGTVVVPRRPREINVGDGGIARMQATELLRNGPRQLWFAALSDSRVDSYGRLRMSALEAFCTSEGLEPPRYVSVPLPTEGAAAAVTEMISDGTPVGVASYNNDVALAILSAARKLNVTVPDQLSIVGVDNVPLGHLWSLPLTTIDTDLGTLADALISALSERLTGVISSNVSLSHHGFRLVPGETA